MDYITHQVPLSMGFSKQEYWSGLPCPPPGDLPDLGIEPRSPALQADSLLCEQEILGCKLHKGKGFCFLGFVSLLIFSVLYSSRATVLKVGRGELVSTTPNPRNICQYLETFLIVTTRGGVMSVPSGWRWDAAKWPTIHRPVSPQQRIVFTLSRFSRV